MYGIAYNSDVIIDDPVTLSTLCVFYDQIYLPSITTSDYVKLEQVSEGSPDLRVSGVTMRIILEHPRWGKIHSGDDIDRWEKEYSPLLTHKVIERLNPPKSLLSHQDLAGIKDPELFRLLLASPHVYTAEAQVVLGRGKKSRLGKARTLYMVRNATVEHLLRTDLDLPSIFLTRNRADTGKIFSALAAKSVFSYVIPSLSDLRPEQILAVREKVADNREGFLMHLQKLSKEVQSLTDQRAPFKDIEAKAEHIVETDIIPDYVEFRRQLESERAGFWKKVLDRSSKVLEIDAAPWTPKFWSDLIRGLALTGLATTADRKESLSNKSQAFHFMRKLETYGQEWGQ